MKHTLKVSATATVIAFAMASSVGAQAWPNRAVRVVVPFAPGGGVDTVGRLLATKLGEQTSGVFIVDNRPGGGGVAGTAIVAKAAPDGYTLLVSASEFSVNPGIRTKLSYDALADFAPISQLTEGHLMIAAHPSVPVKSVQQLIALAKAQPGKLNYGSSGSGGFIHLTGTLFQAMSGARWVHVPFKGAGPATIAAMGGEVDFVIASTTGLIEPVRSGRLRAIAVTGSRRFAGLPDVPTVAESGVPGFNVAGWYGFYGPSGMPAAIVRRLHAEARRALTDSDMAARLVKSGNLPIVSTPDEFAAFLRVEIAKWTQVIKAEGIERVD
jgi:tripartite-type tricarboxylate transporter receptor subunit TctC